MKASAAIKMEELMVDWLTSDDVYENVLEWIETYQSNHNHNHVLTEIKALKNNNSDDNNEENKQPEITPSNSEVGKDDSNNSVTTSTTNSSNSNSNSNTSAVIPPFYPPTQPKKKTKVRYHVPVAQYETWEPLKKDTNSNENANNNGETKSDNNSDSNDDDNEMCARDAALGTYEELGVVLDTVTLQQMNMNTDNGNENDTNNDENENSPSDESSAAASAAAATTSGTSTNAAFKHRYLTRDAFVRITKEVCRFPSYFNIPLYQRICDYWNIKHSNNSQPMTVVTYEMLEYYWLHEMEEYDIYDRFFRLVKQIHSDCIVRDDFLPFLKALLADHPGLEFLSSHAEFQEKYAVTVITRIFYEVCTCHSGKINSRQIRKSDLLDAFQQVDEEEDINKVTRYFSYEHFYVLYCRFWELDHDRDYRITREDLLKYGDHSLSHMIVDRVFDAAPRPFHIIDANNTNTNKDYLSYEDFIYFMLSEEDKSNEISVRYWFTCVDVDGDGKLNNMEMRSFYAVQLHRMQCMGHEIVPFEDMLCQMMDMIKPANTEYLILSDFLQQECNTVSGSLFDALFNLNKYLLFEQRDPFVERQKREDEFNCDWDRFACIDYNRLAMEEEAREEEAMEIDWVNVEEDNNNTNAADNTNTNQNNNNNNNGAAQP